MKFSFLKASFLIYTIIFVQISPQSLLANESTSSILEYIQMYKQYEKNLGTCGDHTKGEIEIVLDPIEIENIQDIQYKRLVSKWGHDFALQSSRVGIVAQDQYWLWIRDAVIFPSKAKGTYERIVWRNQLKGAVGVIVLPVLADGRLVLNANYRHATRSWELELPRGLRDEGENNVDAAIRELLEETGCVAQEVIELGYLSPDSGILLGNIPVFLGKVISQQNKNTEFSEAIESHVILSPKELQEAFKTGYIEISTQEKVQRLECRDAATAFAFLQAILKGHIKTIPATD
jgi:ADP-ribose pyrophosphatase